MLSAVADFSLPLVVAVDLCGVVVFDAGDEFVEQIDELRGKPCVASNSASITAGSNNGSEQPASCRRWER
ncbi:MAG: hypothetical protein A3G24_28460 [Betaproteobacteria bacterium RIFCSPLOWO2_12_FULL_62_13]|nr:MAG: hypothetical protein A3G24_28460 [Betaproteobacteria bacterium RIFCSPLOWO2_12_FULL_62_13]